MEGKIAQIIPRINFFANLAHATLSISIFFVGGESKNYRPAPPNNDVSEEKRRPNGHTTPGRGNGPAGKKIRVERKMNG